MGFAYRRGKKRFEILIYFSLWKSLLPLHEKQTYNCDVCLKKKLNEDRVCYRFNDSVTLPIPHLIEFNDEFDVPQLLQSWKQEITAEELLENVIVPLSKLLPEQPAFEIASDIGRMCNWNKTLCLTGLIDLSYIEIMDLYQLCAEYKTLPESGGVLDQEPKLMEIFQILKSEEIRFEKIRIDSQKKS